MPHWHGYSGTVGVWQMSTH